MRVLIVKTSSMGDVVHALPAVSDLVLRRAGVQVDWLVERAFAAIPSHHRCVDRVLPMAWRRWRRTLLRPQSGREARAELAQCWRELRTQPYDLVVDLQGLLKSVAFAACAQGPRAGYDRHSIREPAASLFYQHRYAVSRELHAVERCRRLMALACDYPLAAEAPPDFGLTVAADADGIEHRPARPYGVLIPCASRPEKLWPQPYWIELGRAWRDRGLLPVVLWGSPQEHERALGIATACGGIVPPFLSVAQAMPLLSGASLIAGLDTGLTHLAAALGRPTLGIYCDHEPGLAGITGPGPVASVGGKGRVPSQDEVGRALARLHGDNAGPT